MVRELKTVILSNPFTDKPYFLDMFNSICVLKIFKKGEADVFDFATGEKINTYKY